MRGILLGAWAVCALSAVALPASASLIRPGSIQMARMHGAPIGGDAAAHVLSMNESSGQWRQWGATVPAISIERDEPTSTFATAVRSDNGTPSRRPGSTPVGSCHGWLAFSVNSDGRVEFTCLTVAVDGDRVRARLKPQIPAFELRHGPHDVPADADPLEVPRAAGMVAVPAAALR